MKNKTTHIICILDRSTSMDAQQNEVICNFNKFLEEQQLVPGKAKLTLALFDTDYELVYDKVDIQDARPLNHETFRIQGATALHDAIGKTLEPMRNKKKAIVLIHTDGAENSSQQYTQGTVKELVDTLKKKWEFIFVGGDIDARRTSGDLGIVRSAAVSNDIIGTANTYANFCNATTAYRSGGLEASANVGLVENGRYANTGDLLNEFKNASGDIADLLCTEIPPEFGLADLSDDDLMKLKAKIHSKDVPSDA